MFGLAYGVKTNDHMLSRFHLIPERYRQTDLLYQFRADARSKKSSPSVRIYLFSSEQRNSAAILRMKTYCSLLLFKNNKPTPRSQGPVRAPGL